MSQFPRRMIEDLPDDDHVRRLLESARSDEPPANLVASAISIASKGARVAGQPGTTAFKSLAGKGRRSAALIAGAVVASAVVVWTAAHEVGTRSGGASTPTLVTEPSREAVPTAASTAAIAGDEHARQAPKEEDAHALVGGAGAATSVADLPDAPTPSTAARTTGAGSTASTPRVAAPETNVPEQAADLLREANLLRARGQWSEAAATYQKVIELGPDSAEAYPADVALGNLELQQRRPLLALTRYDHALATHPNGALSEEARWGKARALRAAGRIEEERATLHEFRTRHPDSPLVRVADQRLAEIGN